MNVVRERTKALYGEGMERVVPAEIKAAAENAKREHVPGGTLVWDKNATPAEPAQGWATFERTTRPSEIVAGRSSTSEANTHEAYVDSFANYGHLSVHAGSVMVRQFEHGYIGAAHPFTFPPRCRWA